MKMYAASRSFSYFSWYMDNGVGRFGVESTWHIEFIAKVPLSYTDKFFLKIICLLNMILIANLDIFSVSQHLRTVLQETCLYKTQILVFGNWCNAQRKQSDPDKMSSNFQSYSVVLSWRPCSYRVVNCVKEYNPFTRRKVNWVVQLVIIFPVST